MLGFARRQATIEEAGALGAIDAGSLKFDAIAEADLVVLCAPVLALAPLCAAMMPHLRPGALVTDVGSTKAALVERLDALLPAGVDLVGGHPMAGSERVGVSAASETLFEGATWVLTRASRTQDASVERLAQLVRALGATPVEMDPRQHDAAVARISHLPHIAAAALAAAAVQGGVPEEVLRLLVAGGFKSTTRIAASSPEMWRDICLDNREAILAALTDYETALAVFRAALAAGDSEALLERFAKGKKARDGLAPPT